MLGVFPMDTAMALMCRAGRWRRHRGRAPRGVGYDNAKLQGGARPRRSLENAVSSTSAEQVPLSPNAAPLAKPRVARLLRVVARTGHEHAAAPRNSNHAADLGDVAAVRTRGTPWHGADHASRYGTRGQQDREVRVDADGPLPHPDADLPVE
jgi:hypothetical protein